MILFDYPDFAKKLSKKVVSNKNKFWHTNMWIWYGNGISAANKRHKNIRAALCFTVQNHTKLSRIA